MTRKSRIARFIFFAVAALAGLSFVAERLWNWLMPVVFGLPSITFWQAIGLLVLSKILFGGFRAGPGGHRFWRRKMMERWEAMTPEEREQFRQGMSGRCGPLKPAITDQQD
jgi:hypothetical protein